MDIEVKNLLEENLKLSKENNILLLKINNAQRWAKITRYIYWGIILFASIGGYYFIQPYLNNLLNVYTGGVSGLNNVGDITDTLMNKQQEMQNLLEELNR